MAVRCRVNSSAERKSSFALKWKATYKLFASLKFPPSPLTGTVAVPRTTPRLLLTVLPIRLLRLTNLGPAMPEARLLTVHRTRPRINHVRPMPRLPQTSLGRTTILRLLQIRVTATAMTVTPVVDGSTPLPEPR
jgi:hypothetical protein